MDDVTKPEIYVGSDGAEFEVIRDAESDLMTLCFRAAVDKAIADSFAKGFPVARWDHEKKAPYFEYPDGTKDYSRHIDKNKPARIKHQKLYFPHRRRFRAMELSNVRQFVNVSQTVFSCLTSDNSLFIMRSFNLFCFSAMLAIYQDNNHILHFTRSL